MEDKELHINRKEFREIVIGQNQNENIIVSICELGFCIIAKRPISKGERIFSFAGPIIDFLETKRRGEQECMPVQTGDNLYIDTEAPWKYINHSCEPNAGIRNNSDLIALEDIPLHAEIRFDYSTTMDENSFTMECKCGKPSCRKVVTDFRLLPRDIQERYFELGIVMDFIRKKYEMDPYTQHLISIKLQKVR